MSRTQISFRLMQKALLTAALVVSFGAASLHAEDKKEVPPDWKKVGKWAALTQYIGTYEYAKVFEDKAVKAELDTMLKGRDINLKTEFSVMSSIGFENDCLVLKGNRDRAADTNSSYMEVCVADGTVNIAIQDGKTITVFTRSSDYSSISYGMGSWIYFKNNDIDVSSQKPKSVQMIVITP